MIETLGGFLGGGSIVAALALALRWWQGRKEQRVSDFEAITKGYQGVFDELRDQADDLIARLNLCNQDLKAVSRERDELQLQNALCRQQEAAFAEERGQLYGRIAELEHKVLDLQGRLNKVENGN